VVSSSLQGEPERYPGRLTCRSLGERFVAARSIEDGDLQRIRNVRGIGRAEEGGLCICSRLSLFVGCFLSETVGETRDRLLWGRGCACACALRSIICNMYEIARLLAARPNAALFESDLYEIIDLHISQRTPVEARPLIEWHPHSPPE
jgi:hypothetical protein